MIIRGALKRLAWLGATVATLRTLLFIAKVIATAGTIDSALEIVGLHQPVDWFESAIDDLAMSALDFILRVADR